MNRATFARFALAGALAMSLGARAMPRSRVAIRVVPSSHDFGKEIVGKTAGNPEVLFEIQLSPGATANDRVSISVSQTTQQDFKVDEGPSWLPPSGPLTPTTFACECATGP